MNQLLGEIRSCTICSGHLPNPPKPIVQASIHSRIVIVGQAPGQKVQNSGIPWNDASGNELRRWLGVSADQFYDDQCFALVPMGFCYPGKGPSGDLPPRSECAPLWHPKLWNQLKAVQFAILIGQYAHQRYLGNNTSPTLTETVKRFNQHLPTYLPLVHPSPRNRIWQKKNPWFELEVIPVLQGMVKEILV